MYTFGIFLAHDSTLIAIFVRAFPRPTTASRAVDIIDIHDVISTLLGHRDRVRPRGAGVKKFAAADDAVASSSSWIITNRAPER